MAPIAWYKEYLTHADSVEIEVMESFCKQTYRNRCLVHDTQAHPITLSIPVRNVDHKQLTKDVTISYQQHWQHQHWMALKSAYGKRPYWEYYADLLAPFYQHEWKWLIDYNEQMHTLIMQLLHNSPQALNTPLRYTQTPPSSTYNHTQSSNTDTPIHHTLTYTGATLDQYWGDGTSIMDMLMEYGPLTPMLLAKH